MPRAQEANQWNRWGQTRLIESNALSRIFSTESDPIGLTQPRDFNGV